LGRARRAPAGAIRRWKAPRVQRIAFPFAGVRVRRPCLGTEPRPQGSGPATGRRRSRSQGPSRSQARSCQGTPEGGLRDAGNSSLRSPRAATRGVRAEWVGAKLPRERSRREVPSRGKLTSAKPLAHDISTGRGSRKGTAAIRSSGPRSKGCGHETGCIGGRPLVRSCGVQSSVVVLADRIDCRSRQAARGPSRPKAKSFRTTMKGSSPSARERRRGERASEAGSSVAKPRDRWRAPSKPVGSRERIDLGAPVEGRRFGSGKSSPFDEGAAEAVLVPRKCPGFTDSGRLRGATGSVRGRTSASRMAENAKPRWHRQRGGCPDLPSPKGEQRRARIDRSWRRAVKRAPSRGRIAARRSGVAWNNPTSPLSGGKGRGCFLRSAQRKLRARKSNGSRVLVSTVDCRGRREASSPRHRGEPRGKPRLHGVARCGGGS